MSLDQMLQPSSSSPPPLPSTSSHRHLPAPWNHVQVNQKQSPASPSSHGNHDRGFPSTSASAGFDNFRRSPHYHEPFLTTHPPSTFAPGSQILHSLRTASTSSSDDDDDADLDTDDELEALRQVSSEESDLFSSDNWDDIDDVPDASFPTATSTNISQSTSTTIDLTQDPESPTMPVTQPSRKRRTSGAHITNEEPSFKRQKSAGPSGSNSQSSAKAKSTLPSKIEEIDLADENDDVAQVLQRQREEQVLAQYSKEGRKKSKLCDLSCAVCMEPPTEVTATVCGHYFCRDCLLRWLAASEKEGPRKSNCPSCRKPLSRTKKTDIIPLEIMTVKAKLKR